MRLTAAISLMLCCTVAWADTRLTPSPGNPVPAAVEPRREPDQSQSGTFQSQRLQSTSKTESRRMKALSERSAARHGATNNAVENQK